MIRGDDERAFPALGAVAHKPAPAPKKKKKTKSKTAKVNPDNNSAEAPPKPAAPAAAPAAPQPAPAGAAAAAAAAAVAVVVPDKRKKNRAASNWREKTFEDCRMRTPPHQVKLLRQALSPAVRTNQLFLTNHFLPFSASDAALRLSDQAKRLNARTVSSAMGRGHAAALSEALSFELLHRLFSAELVKTENAVRYASPQSKRVDYTCRMVDCLVGVSVTRVFRGRSKQMQGCSELVRKKVEGLLAAREGVVDEDKWDVGLLHVWVPSEDVEIAVRRAHEQLMGEGLRVCVMTTVAVINCRMEYSFLFGG